MPLYAHAPRFLVVGDDNLAFRLVRELVDTHGAKVTAVVRSINAGTSARLTGIDGVTVVERPDDYEALDVDAYDAVALCRQDDGGNVDAALQIRELDPDLRIVMRVFDETLADSVRHMLPDVAVLSATAVAAPAFVGAALGDSMPTPMLVANRLLFATERANTRPADVLATLGETGEDPHVLGPATGPDDLVLASDVRDEGADDHESRLRAGTGLAAAAARGRRIRRRARRRAWWAFTSLIGRRLGIVASGVAVVVVAAATVTAALRHVSWWKGFYVAALSTFNGVSPDLKASTGVQVVDVVLGIVSVAIIPAVTATVVEAVVSARIALSSGGLAVPVEDHYVVVGLGDVGTRVLVALDDLGVAVVGVERDPQAVGVGIARMRRVPVLIQDGVREATLRAASAETARGIIVTTSSDVANLEAALAARKVSPDIRAVLRIFDGDFAERVQRAFGFAVSRSVSNLAAPAFAAAMLGRDVVATLSVGRRVLVVADLAAGGTGRLLVGHKIAHLDADGAVRVLALRPATGPTVWRPAPDRVVSDGDHVVAVATRAGFATLLSGGAEPVSVTIPDPAGVTTPPTP